MSSQSEMVNIYCDGASRGNPGPASLGVAAFAGNEDISLGRFKKAEYAAILQALQKCIELKIQAPRLHSDSELVIRQLQGRYKVKNENLKRSYTEALKLVTEVKPQLIHVPREKNQIADYLANRALDTP